jgi:hypothetical protein
MIEKTLFEIIQARVPDVETALHLKMDIEYWYSNLTKSMLIMATILDDPENNAYGLYIERPNHNPPAIISISEKEAISLRSYMGIPTIVKAAGSIMNLKPKDES